ncbi:MAG: 50S ribosomal protein L24 [bacterium]
MRIRRGDTVVARSGRNAAAGKTGKVLTVMPEKRMAVVEGFNLVKKALRKTQDNPAGGISDKELPLPLSRLALFCPNCKKGVRIGLKSEGERKVRKCKQCGHPFDA